MRLRTRLFDIFDWVVDDKNSPYTEPGNLAVETRRSEKSAVRYLEIIAAMRVLGNLIGRKQGAVHHRLHAIEDVATEPLGEYVAVGEQHVRALWKPTERPRNRVLAHKPSLCMSHGQQQRERFDFVVDRRGDRRSHHVADERHVENLAFFRDGAGGVESAGLREKVLMQVGAQHRF